MKIISLFLLFPLITWSQTLPSRWDELTASDWEMALKKSDSTCILPIGILEKHGSHGPIGSDLIKVREWSARATKRSMPSFFQIIFMGKSMKPNSNMEPFHCRVN